MKTSRNFNSLFDTLYGIMDNEAWTSRYSGNYMPAINILESAAQYEIEIAVPGVSKEEFTIQIDSDNNLIIAVEKGAQAPAEKQYLRQGFRTVAFRQRIVLPEDVNRNEVSARIDNGILYIELPRLKPEVVKPEVRNITIA